MKSEKEKGINILVILGKKQKNIIIGVRDIKRLEGCL